MALADCHRDGHFEEIREENWEMNRKVPFLVFLSALLIAPMLVSNVYAVSISPSNSQVILNTSQTFTITGLNESRTYTAKLDGSVIDDSFVPSSSGEYILSVSITTTGGHTLTIVDDTDDSTVASASIYGYDLLAVIMPYIILGIILGVIFNFSDDIQNMF